MQETKLQQLLQTHLPDCTVEVSGDGHHFDAKLIGECFQGLRTVARQQKVYQIVGELIRSGELHALNIHAYTNAEWATKNRAQG
ncbi:MAG: BolA/IbaG family iron-sulfur metabolism protein [Legionellales bacterium]|nr:BolA/IbaG family iron-sulfur metabolism protein [Legionellales bacterium]